MGRERGRGRGGEEIEGREKGEEGKRERKGTGGKEGREGYGGSVSHTYWGLDATGSDLWIRANPMCYGVAMKSLYTTHFASAPEDE